MRGRLTHTEVETALQDLKSRTLASISHSFGRLIYLASTRDYNTGRYYHDGLAFQFSEEIARRALAQAHEEVFVDLALTPLKNLANQMQLYFESVGSEPLETVRGWEKLEAYRVVIPLHADALTAGLFLANVKITLPIVEARLRNGR
jgi:hypothetical protein